MISHMHILLRTKCREALSRLLQRKVTGPINTLYSVSVSGNAVGRMLTGWIISKMAPLNNQQRN